MLNLRYCNRIETICGDPQLTFKNIYSLFVLVKGHGLNRPNHKTF